MMDLRINGSRMKLNDDGSVEATQDVINEVNDKITDPDGKKGYRPDIAKDMRAE